MLKTTLIATCLSGLVLAAQPAFAQTDAAASANSGVVVQHRSVRYADLDLATAAGQSELTSRLRRAASAVCESNYGPHPLAESMEARHCYREALQSAQRTLADRGIKPATVKVAAR